MGMDETGRSRAAALVRDRMSALGISPGDVALLADVDTSTVRDLAEGHRWPWTKNRAKIETALGLSLGDLDRAARGELTDRDKDEVVAAIERTSLSRSNKAALISAYYGMVDEMGEVKGA